MDDRRHPTARDRVRHLRLPMTLRVKARFRTHDTARMRGAIRIVLAIPLFTACASATSSVVDNGAAATTFRAAAQKTLAADSFHADATQQLSSGSGKGTVDYQAPDREDERNGTGRWATETISIGDTAYFSNLNKPGYFWRFEGAGIGASDSLIYLRFLEHAENVRIDGLLYRFELAPYPGGPSEGSTSGVATLTDEGFIHTLLFHWQLAGDAVSVGFTYSGYNSGITVKPPPPDLIVKQAPAVACPSPMPPASGVLPNGADFCEAIKPSPQVSTPSASSILIAVGLVRAFRSRRGRSAPARTARPIAGGPSP